MNKIMVLLLVQLPLLGCFNQKKDFDPDYNKYKSTFDESFTSHFPDSLETIINPTRKYSTFWYFNGGGVPVAIGDQTTKELINSDKFKEKHAKITSQKVDPEGYFSVDMTSKTFHVGNTGVDYSVTSNGNASAVTYTLFTNTDKDSPNETDGYWDADFIDEELGMQKADEMGPNLERFGGTPYPYKTSERTYFFKPVQ